MTVHNQLGLYPRLAPAIGLAVGLQEGEEGVVRLSETLQGVVDPWTVPSWAILRGEILQWGSALVGAAVGLRSMLAVVNPEGSRRVITVRRIYAAAAFHLNNLFPAPVGGVGGWVAQAIFFGRDFRLGSPGTYAAPNRLLTNNTTASQGTVTFIVPTTPFIFEGEVVLGPNNALLITPRNDNEVLTVSVISSERMLLPGEPRQVA